MNNWVVKATWRDSTCNNPKQIIEYKNAAVNKCISQGSSSVKYVCSGTGDNVPQRYEYPSGDTNCGSSNPTIANLSTGCDPSDEYWYFDDTAETLRTALMSFMCTVNPEDGDSYHAYLKASTFPTSSCEIDEFTSSVIQMQPYCFIQKSDNTSFTFVQNLKYIYSSVYSGPASLCTGFYTGEPYLLNQCQADNGQFVQYSMVGLPTVYPTVPPSLPGTLAPVVPTRAPTTKPSPQGTLPPVPVPTRAPTLQAPTKVVTATPSVTKSAAPTVAATAVNTNSASTLWLKTTTYNSNVCSGQIIAEDYIPTQWCMSNPDGTVFERIVCNGGVAYAYLYEDAACSIPNTSTPVEPISMTCGSSSTFWAHPTSSSGGYSGPAATLITCDNAGYPSSDISADTVVMENTYASSTCDSSQMTASSARVQGYCYQFNAVPQTSMLLTGSEIENFSSSDCSQGATVQQLRFGDCVSDGAGGYTMYSVDYPSSNGNKGPQFPLAAIIVIAIVGGLMIASIITTIMVVRARRSTPPLAEQQAEMSAVNNL